MNTYTYQANYNFEHEDIHYTALINHAMINSLIDCFIYMQPILQPLGLLLLVTICAYHLFKFIGILAFLKWLLNYVDVWAHSYLEHTYFLSVCICLSSALFASVYLLQRLDALLDKVKKENEELQEHLDQLEKENEEMKSTYRIMLTYADTNTMQRTKQLIKIKKNV